MDTSQLFGRTKLILLGDSLGDTQMAQNFEHEVVLKIGFVHYPTAENIAAYEQAFDVLLYDDPSFDSVSAFLKTLFARS